MDLKIGFVLIALLAGSLAAPSSDAEDSDFFYHTDPSSRILGGVQAVVGSAPHMAAMTSGSLLASFLCGGSLVTTRSVITAAHCIDAVYSRGKLINSLRITVGTNRWKSGGDKYRVSRNITHTHWTPQRIKNDIGFLVLAKQVTLSDRVRPMPLSFDYVPGGVVTRVFGWGKVRTGGTVSSMLMELTMSTIDGERCVREVAQAAVDFNVRAYDVEPHIEICTFHSDNHGTCNGDSGSALVRVDRGAQIGVVSWGFPCARGAPDMFARISGFTDWITDNIVY